MRNPTPWLLATASPHIAQLPEHCSPTSTFLEHISSTFNTCLPTPLAFASTLVGTLSIGSWLFAQFPQVIRNYQNQSVAGLSGFFLVEWLLGDISNLLGALFTNQATWQVIIGAYYCFVDIALVSQWIWYERLRHGRPLKRIWLPIRRKGKETPTQESMTQGRRHVVGEITNTEQEALEHGGEIVITRRASTEPRDIPTSRATTAEDAFRIPVYGTMSPSTSLAASPANRTITRIQQRNSLPGGNSAPKTVLFLTLLIALAARASPTPSTLQPTTVTTAASIPEKSTLYTLGQALSWLSTALYLASRLPQLILNFRRQSTSGLSPTLFAAAFAGNLCYATSLALNPCAWSDFSAYGGHGWAGAEGSDRAAWVGAALPFFLGAAGVLVFDGTVGVQFWVYGGGNEVSGEGREEMLVVREEMRKERKVRVRRVSGWMRGWQPSAGGGVRPVKGRGAAGEEEGLLGGGRERG